VRGEKYSKLAIIVHVAGGSEHPDGLARNACQVGTAMELVLPDADRSALPCDALIIDVNVADTRGKVIARISTNGDVEVAHGVK
jgi:hypothetical protein